MDAGIDDLYSGWYYSEGYKVFTDRVTVHGEVNIIITDSSYVQFADGIHVSTGNTLNIYGQSRSDQALAAYADTDDNAAIGANNETDDCGTINIFGGSDAKCGKITIAATVTKVTATKGALWAPYSIGEGNDGVCGTITIGGTVVDPISESPYTYQP